MRKSLKDNLFVTQILICTIFAFIITASFSFLSWDISDIGISIIVPGFLLVLCWHKLDSMAEDRLLNIFILGLFLMSFRYGLYLNDNQNYLLRLVRGLLCILTTLTIAISSNLVFTYFKNTVLKAKKKSKID